jgi:hypothetical protein
VQHSNLNCIVFFHRIHAHEFKSKKALSMVLLPVLGENETLESLSSKEHECMQLCQAYLLLVSDELASGSENEAEIQSGSDADEVVEDLVKVESAQSCT